MTDATVGSTTSRISVGQLQLNAGRNSSPGPHLFVVGFWLVLGPRMLVSRNFRYPLVNVYIAIEHGPVEIVNLPSYKMVDLSIVVC